MRPTSLTAGASFEAVASGEIAHFNDLSEILPILRKWLARQIDHPDTPHQKNH